MSRFSLALRCVFFGLIFSAEFLTIGASSVHAQAIVTQRPTQIVKPIAPQKSIKVGYYSATAPAPTLEAVPATPNPDGSMSFQASRTDAVALGDKQKSSSRSLALYTRKTIERDEWVEWDEATPALHAFLAARDPATAANLKPHGGAFFRVFDLDGDGKMDLVMRFGSRTACSDDAIGCTHAIYYADGKARVLYHARKFLPVKNGVMLNNKFYAIMPKGGEDFTTVSYMLYKPYSEAEAETQAISQQMQNVFPEFYKETGRMPSFNYAKYDLNGDGKPEIVIQITEDDEEFDLCDPKDGILCPMVFYSQAASDKPLLPLGHFLSMQDLVFARTSAPGFADIITTTNDNIKGRTVVYTMNSSTGLYELEK